MNLHFRLLFVFILLSYYKIKAQTQITDFHYRDGDMPSLPIGFVQFEDQIFFQASTPDNGTELWVSDGSQQNTRVLKDICPGESDGLKTPFPKPDSKSAVVGGDQLFFIGSDGDQPYQLWSTQGTDANTKVIANLPGEVISELAFVDNHVFFLIQNPSKEQIQVWKSNGTEEGTMLVKSISSRRGMFGGIANNLFFFTAQVPQSNRIRLWRSDGTEMGTFPITTELDGNGAGITGTSNLTQFITLNDELYVVVRSSALFSYPTNVGIIKTDGSVQNTIAIKAIHDGTRLIHFADVIEVNGNLYFSFFETALNRLFIWESDGTSQGTKLIYDEFGEKFYVPSFLSTDGSNLLFTGRSQNSETALLSLNLTSYEVSELQEVWNDAPTTSRFTQFSANKIFPTSDSTFLLSLTKRNDPDSATWLYSTALQTTVPVADIFYVREAINYRGNTYFRHQTDQENSELWQAGPLFNNPQLLVNINAVPYGLDQPTFGMLPNKIIMGAFDEVANTELWAYDSPTDQLEVLKEVSEGELRSMPIIHTNYKNVVYFSARDLETGEELWRTDGTKEGTRLVEDINPGSLSSQIRHLAVVQDKMFFAARINDQYFLCTSDGETVTAIKGLGKSEFGYAFEVLELFSTGDDVYFVTAGDGLWRSDGTEEGTIKIKDLGGISGLVMVQDQLFFLGSESDNRLGELWKSDGSASGTVQVDLSTIGNPTDIDNLIAWNDQLIFTAYSEESGKEFFIYDVPTESIQLLANINANAASAVVSDIEYTLTDEYLYFTANDGTHGTELWRTDGTTAGTELVSDINQGAFSSFPKNLKSYNDKIYFSAFSPQYGQELWVTEGTESSTKLLVDIAEGSTGSLPKDIMFSGDELFFTAVSTQSGRQFYSYDPASITSLAQVYNPTEFNLYPNPASDYLTLRQEALPKQHIYIHDLYGRSIKARLLDSGKIYIGDLVPGVYIIEIISGQRKKVQKFIKE